jgi:CRP-like cAMP-binding protein
MPTLGPAGPSAGAPDRGPTSTSQAGLGPAGAPAPRRRGDSAAPPRARGDSSPAVAVPRTRSKPITIQPGAALDTVDLHSLVAGSHHRDVSGPGIAVIPLDDDEMVLEVDAGGDDDGGLEIETLAVETDDDEVLELEPAEVDDVSELELGDLEEIPLPVPRAVGAAARRALAATPLFAGLPSEALEDLVGRLTIVPLGPGEILFNEGDPGDALYVIVEGEVSVSGQGPTHGELSRLGPGAFIGEVALMTEQPRAATVAAVEHAELLRIDRVTLSEVLANHGDLLRAVLRFVRERLVDRWMRTSPLFRPFDDSERSALVARFRFLEIEAGTVVLTPGTRPDGLYIVLAGQLSVKRDVATAALLGPGDLIGENALLSGGKIQSEVAARTKVLALCLPAADFREMIMTHPHVLEYIGEQAEQRRRLHIL